MFAHEPDKLLRVLLDDPDRIKRELQRVIGKFLFFEYLPLRAAVEYAAKLRPSYSRPAFMNGDAATKAKRPRKQQPDPESQPLPSGSGLGSAAQQSGTLSFKCFSSWTHFYSTGIV